MRADCLFYCFVDFGREPGDRPGVHVVPAAVVGEVLEATHAQWLATPGRNGQAHKDNAMRRLLPDYSRVYRNVVCPYTQGWLERYRNAWSLLGMEPMPVDEQDLPEQAEQ